MFQVSVIVPTYNRESFIVEALDSIAKQKFKPMETIVVDDGSTDRTKQLVQNHFTFARYIKTVHKGVSSARNIGISIASGKFIAFLDSDDIWYAEKLEKQMQFFEENPNCRIVHCNEEWRKNGRLVNQKRYHRKSGGDIFYDSLARCVISPSGVIIRKDLLAEVGLFNEEFPACEDYDLWLRITSFEKVGFVDLPLLIKRGGHSDQLSQSVQNLDRFRIKSLMKVIREKRLGQKKLKAAKEEALKKIVIYRGGALKRRKYTEVNKMDKLLWQIHLV